MKTSLNNRNRQCAVGFSLTEEGGHECDQRVVDPRVELLLVGLALLSVYEGVVLRLQRLGEGHHEGCNGFDERKSSIKATTQKRFCLHHTCLP